MPTSHDPGVDIARSARTEIVLKYAVSRFVFIRQVVISVGSGPWDALFGGGNVPAFVTAAVFAFIGAVCAGVFLPRKLLVNSGSEEAGDESLKEEVAI